jgi:hypothetical protein
LIVIDVVTAPEVDVGKEGFHVGKRRDVDAALPHFAARELVVRVATHQRRQVEGDAQTGAAGRKQTTVALVGLFRRPEARKLAHRPELAVVASGVNAARVRKVPGVAQIPVVVERFDALRGVKNVAGHELIISSGFLGLRSTVHSRLKR